MNTATEIEQLREENERLHQRNLELNLRLSEVLEENHQSWAFAIVAKRFRDKLLQENYQGESKEWIAFIVGFGKLKDWLTQRQQELDQTGLFSETDQPAT